MIALVGEDIAQRRSHPVDAGRVVDAHRDQPIPVPLLTAKEPPHERLLLALAGVKVPDAVAGAVIVSGDGSGVDPLRGHIVEEMCQRKDLGAAEVRDGVLHRRIDQLIQVDQRGGRHQLPGNGLNKLLLAAHASEIRLGVVAKTRIAHRLLPIEALSALLQVDMQVAPVVVIVHILLDIDDHAAHGIDHVLGAIHLDDDVVVDFDAEKLLHGGLRKGNAADGMRRVDLVGAPAISKLHARVARHREHTHALRVQIQADDEDGIGAGILGVHNALWCVVGVNPEAQDVEPVLVREGIARVRGRDPDLTDLLAQTCSGRHEGPAEVVDGSRRDACPDNQDAEEHAHEPTSPPPAWAQHTRWYRSLHHFRYGHTPLRPERGVERALASPRFRCTP